MNRYILSYAIPAAGAALLLLVALVSLSLMCARCLHAGERLVLLGQHSVDAATVQDARLVYDPEQGTVIIGLVSNNTNCDLLQLEAEACFEGGCASAPLNPPQLAPGESGGFWAYLTTFYVPRASVEISGLLMCSAPPAQP